VFVVTINRPACRNPLNFETKNGLADLVEELDRRNANRSVDDRCRAPGAGSR
jgi:enoyl-CoA hydratase/carnithine racemase